MNTAVKMNSRADRNWKELAAELGAKFAELAAKHDDDNVFVHDNYAVLRDHGLFKLGIPRETWR